MGANYSQYSLIVVEEIRSGRQQRQLQLSTGRLQLRGTSKHITLALDLLATHLRQDTDDDADDKIYLQQIEIIPF